MLRNNQTIDVPNWNDVEPGKDKWTILNLEHHGQDGCYMVPYVFQGNHWVSYYDEWSSATKEILVT